jgi:hypothetical protein
LFAGSAKGAESIVQLGKSRENNVCFKQRRFSESVRKSLEAACSRIVMAKAEVPDGGTAMSVIIMEHSLTIIGGKRWK